MKKVITIAGSDSSGGSGIQADIKMFHSLKCHGFSVITAITSQNMYSASGVFPLSSSVVTSQLQTVCKEEINAIKIGMVHSASIIRAIAKHLKNINVPIVLDTPIISSSGKIRLLKENGIEALKQQLFPLASVITPNLHEAELLIGEKIKESDLGLKRAFLKFSQMGAAAVLLKGGHSRNSSPVCTDFFFHKGTITKFSSPRIKISNIRGTGCSLSSAIAAFLARGKSLQRAVQLSKKHLTLSIQQCVPISISNKKTYFVINY